VAADLVSPDHPISDMIPTKGGPRQMPWVTDLASTAGIPAGAASLAVTMYAACAAAEKAARPQALNDIARILNDPSVERSVHPSGVIEQVFTWTFGERHLSWKCVRRSAIATVLFATFAGCFLFNAAVTDTLVASGRVSDSASGVMGASIGVLATLFFFGLLPDYVALWKTRYLVSVLPRRRFGLVITPVLDLILSCAIGYLCAVLLWVVVIIAMSATGLYMQPTETGFSYTSDPRASFIDLLLRSHSLRNWYEILLVSARGTFPDLMGHVDSLRGLLFLSTLFTSIWTILILLATTALRLMAPAHRFTAWFFDVDKHPVQAIGIVAGVLVMIGSLIWTVLRAAI
jgi:hypothetical protein